MRAMRARLESRAGGRVGQPWRDLRKQPVIPADAGAFFTAAPVVLMATSVLVAAAAPYLSTRGPLSGVADVVVVGLLLLGAVALADLATTVMASLEHDASDAGGPLRRRRPACDLHAEWAESWRS